MSGAIPTAQTLQEKLYYDLLKDIQQGVYKPGDMLPSESALIESYGVSRVTVRAALAKLVEKNLVVKRRGKGAFVKSGALVESTLTSGSFTETCRAMGLEPQTHILSVQLVPADEVADEGINLSSGRRGAAAATNQVIKISRVRSAGGTPVILEWDYFSVEHSYLLNAPLENRSLFEILRVEGKKQVSGFEDKFQITQADKLAARQLAVETGTPLLEVLETVYGTTPEDVVYVNKQWVVSSRYCYVVRSTK